MSVFTSEADLARPALQAFCEGTGLDVGFGGSALVAHAITMDQPPGQRYTTVGPDRQILQGTAKDLSFICDGALDFIASNHLLEDFTYAELREFIPEWRRVLRPGGYWVTNCPDQQRFLAHCARSGQLGNDAHKEPDFSLATFREQVVAHTGPWEVVMQEPEFGAYSWLLCLRKI